MYIPPEIRKQLPKWVWKSHKTRTIMRQLKELSRGLPERRGQPERYSDQDFIRIYIEVEALARLKTKGVVSRLLDHPDLRLEASDGTRRRLNRLDKQRVRRQHSEGYREARVWEDMKFVGRSHPRWPEIQRCIELRELELRSSAPSKLFFLKAM